jgi:dolichol-phosphate mannosyltransferase
MKHISNVELISNCGDFRAFTKPVRLTISNFHEKHIYLRGLFVLIGFNQAIIQYDRDKRYAGETKYTVRKMFKLAIDAILSFSHFPIRFIFYLSLIMWSTSLIYLIKALFSRFMFGTAIEGWTSIIFFQVFSTGILLSFIALLGSYIGRIYEQGQQRPRYWESYRKNFDK